MLMEYGVTANDANGKGMTVLHILVSLGTLAAVSWFLDRGADINRLDNEFESTPLAWAARVSRIEMIQLHFPGVPCVTCPTMSRGPRPPRGHGVKAIQNS
jgi:hypothetical protein